MTNEEYHAHPALGSSNLKQLLKNPYAFAMGIKQEESKALDIGSAVHKLVLEPHEFNDEFAIMPDFNLRTTDGKNAKAMFEMDNVGKTVISQSDYEIVTQCANRLKEIAKPFLTGGVPEKAFFGEIDGVAVKCKPDYFIESIGLIVDLKVVKDASKNGFSKACGEYEYYIQEALYCEVLRQNGYNINKFSFLPVEKKEPFMMGVYELDHVAKDFGQKEVRRALEVYSRISDYKIPVYKDITDGTIVQTITLPNWTYYKDGASL